MARPVLLLHGWTMQGAIFDGLIRRLPAGLACRAPDLPGHGAAAGLKPSLDACADLVADELEAMPEAILVGWSMGAAVAWRYIARHGTGGLSGLVTVDMSPRMAPAPGWPHGLKGQSPERLAATTARFASDWPAAARGIARTMFASPAGAPGFGPDAALRLILSHDPAKMRALWDDLVASDAREVIGRIDLPWLVASGALSRVYPAAASDWIASRAPQARRMVFARSGHSPHLEEPGAFAAALAGFAGSLSAAGRLHQ